MGKSTKDQRDHFYRQGKQEGYRARSAYKLLQLDEHYGLFGRDSRSLASVIAQKKAPSDALADALADALGGTLSEKVRAALPPRHDAPGYVIDLCAAPGSWSQVLSRLLGTRGACIVAVDLQAMAPLEHVTQVVGDITTEATAQAVERAFCEAQRDTPSVRCADLIVCDGAPDVTGIQTLDEYVQSQLLMAAFSMALRMLRPGGTFLAKVFVQPQSASARLLLAQLRRSFQHVELAKPSSSRASSAEHFVVCLGHVQHDTSREAAQQAFLGDLQGYS